MNVLNLLTVIGGWLIAIAIVVIAVVVIRKAIARSRRRDANQREMLDLMRRQAERTDDQ